MFRAWYLGKWFAIPIYVHPTFLLLPILALLQNPGGGLLGGVFMITLVLAVFGCVLLHELGHALMARYFGIGTADITLYPIGGVARLNRMSEKPREELLIAVAGPAVNVAIVALLTPLVLLALGSGVLRDGLIVAGHLSLPALLAKFVFTLWLANGVLVLFNLLPAFPMDGGRVLRALLSMRLGQLRATDIAAKVGVVMAAGLMVLSFFVGNPMLLLVAMFVVFAGQQELHALRQRQARSQAVLAPGGALAAEQASVARPTGFTGFIWDQNGHVWVKWQDGQPVAVYWGRTE
jgi:Zn-dependent protease